MIIKKSAINYKLSFKIRTCECYLFETILMLFNQYESCHELLPLLCAFLMKESVYVILSSLFLIIRVIQIYIYLASKTHSSTARIL